MRLYGVKLDYIKDIHVEARIAFSSLNEISPLVKEQSSFSPDSLRSYLVVKPLIVIKVKNKEYHLVAGFREWLLSMDLLNKSENIKCIVLNKTDSVEIDELAWQDVYGSLLIFSAHPKKFALHLAQLIRALPIEFKKQYYPLLGNILQVAKSTDLSRNSFYEDAPSKELKSKAQIDSFEDLMGE